MPDQDRCSCECHQMSVYRDAGPEMTDAVAALTACDLCSILHAGVWTVVPRGYKPPKGEPWKEQADGEEGG